jgi:hypothetical protein
MATLWFEPLGHEGRNKSSPAYATDCFLAKEREQLQSAFLELVGESRQPRTLSNLRHPALKALSWFAIRRDVTDYLTFLTGKVDTSKGCTTCYGLSG